MTTNQARSDRDQPLGARYRSLRDTAAAEIRSRIFDGSYPPGMRLVEDELAAQLDVSRMPVREALTLLEAEGFVEIAPRRGAWVAVVSPEEALDMFEVRANLEGLAARLAAREGEVSALARLQEIVEEGSSLVRAERTSEIPALHQEFHITLAEAGKNSYLIELVSPLPAKIEWIYSTILRARADISWPEHAKIVEAVRSGDEVLAEAVTREHVEEAAREFVIMLERD